MKRLILIAVLLFTPVAAFALETPSALVGASLDLAIKQVMTDLEGVAMSLLFWLALLQFTITGYGMIQNGEIEASVGKAAKFLIWVGVCVWLLSSSGAPGGLSNGGQFIRVTVDYFLKLAGSWTALQGMTFDTGDIFLTGLEAYGKITLSVLKATSTNAANALVTLFVPGVAFLTALMTFAISAVIIITCAYIALKVFMVKLEAMLVIAIAPLSFAFLGLNGLRDQGFAPFKSMLALVYRIVVLGAVVAAMSKVATFLADYVDGQSYGLAADVWSPLLAAAFAFSILAFLAHKSDSIASSLANGSVSMGAGDVTAAVAAGAAAGAAVATGGASAVAGAANAGKSISDVMGMGGMKLSQAGTGTGGGADPFKSMGPAPEKPKNDANSSLSEAKSPAAPHTANPGRDAGRPQTMADRPSLAERKARSAPGEDQTSVPSGSTGATNEDASPTGSGATAGIEGAPPSSTDQKLDKLMDTLGQPKKPSFNDRMGAVNDHLVKEQSATHVSVNVNAAD